MNFSSGIELNETSCNSQCDLPQFISSSFPDLRFISSDVLAELIAQSQFRKFKILDCRFDYEYTGGHIRQSVNVGSPDALLEKLHGFEAGTTLIFHCEFSQLRGPSMCRWLRNYDRTANIENYPRLDYPDLYILHGGYADFFDKFSTLCDPEAYVPAESCKVTMKQEFKAFNRRIKQRSHTTAA